MARTIRDPKARTRIIDAGARAVAERGVHAASMRVIAAEAGVSTGYITHYFADKDELIEAVLDATNRHAAARVLRVARGDGPPLERLASAVDVMLPIDPARRREWQIWVAAWGEAAKGDHLSAGYRAGWTGLRDIFADLLDEARRAGDLAPGVDVRHRADRLVTLLAGIGLLAGVERPGRVRATAELMLAEELAWLGEPQPSWPRRSAPVSGPPASTSPAGA